MLVFLIPYPPFAGVSYSGWHCGSFFGYTSPCSAICLWTRFTLQGAPLSLRVRHILTAPYLRLAAISHPIPLTFHILHPAIYYLLSSYGFVSYLPFGLQTERRYYYPRHRAREKIPFCLRQFASSFI